MKSIIRKFVGAALLLALPLSFTSCDDILGKWDKPLPPAAQVALNAALVNGAEVSISFQVNGTSYTASFTNSEGFTLTGGALPTGYDYEFYEEAGILNFQLKNGDEKECLEITFNTSDNTYAVYAVPGFSFEVEKFKINNTNLTITNAYPKTVTIYYYDNTGTPASEKELVINYKEDETWEEVANRYGVSGVEVFLTAGDADYIQVVIPALSYTGNCIGYGTVPGYPATSALVPKTDKVGKKGTDNYEGKYICYRTGPIG